ncbi:MAG: hypothetical protein Q4D04_15495, partial [Clostridia bacterium]|nr:hypothetical protein [Clostridia bacterium]
SRIAYSFEQGCGDYVFAYDYYRYNLQGYKGVILQNSALKQNDLEKAQVGEYDIFNETVLGGKLLWRDYHDNRFYLSDNPINDQLVNGLS